MSNIDKQALRMRNYLNTAVISGVKLLHLTTDELSGLLDELDTFHKAAGEPAAYQYQFFDPEHDEWGEWQDCDNRAFDLLSEEAQIPDSGVQTRKLYAAQQPATIVPGGYVMVPAKASIVMVRAGAKAAREYLEECGGNSPQVIYQAMVAAVSMQEE